jgi:hypothetical protein
MGLHRAEGMIQPMTNRTFARVFTLGLAIVAVVLAGPAAAQQKSTPAPLPTTHTMLGNDVGNLSDKYVGLALSDTDWHSGVRMFGRDLTKQGATLMLLLDQHEHLGQSIAYARSNNVVPPWSK